MFYQFLLENREEILARTRARVVARLSPRSTDEELTTGVPRFLDLLIQTLRHPTEQINQEMIVNALRHGGDLQRRGFTVAQVVHAYGDVCQVVTRMVEESHAPITVEEFHILNWCLDDAIAQAMTEYTKQLEMAIVDTGTERLGVLAHELRNRLASATMAFDILKQGNVAIGGSTGAILGRNLRSLRDLIERSLAEVRLESGIQNHSRLVVSEFIDEVEAEASLEAVARGMLLSVSSVSSGIEVQVDRPLLAMTVFNLLQNAFKFSRPHARILLTVKASTERVLIDVEDECGGLPVGLEKTLFQPFEQFSPNRSGLGLGLSISRKGTEANGGELRVRDLPGKGCVFTIDLPRPLAA